MTPRRQTTPPDEPGLWIRYRKDWQPHLAVNFALLKVGFEGETALMDVADMTPDEHHDPGDVWEGPFPVPSLPEGEGKD